MPKLAFTFGAATHVGLSRTENQDYFGKFPEDDERLSTSSGQLFVVADGMGGHNAGQVASRFAVEKISQVFLSDLRGEPSFILSTGFVQANSELLLKAENNPNFEGMGTTCSALALKAGMACIAHIGDSRIYRIRDSGMKQLTEDHSHVGEMQRLGVLTKEEALNHPGRSYLTRALGATPEVDVDVYDLEFTEGDHFLLCTDGLGKLDEGEIQKIVLSSAPKKACQKLVDLANKEDGQDNVTVMIVKIAAKSSLKQKLSSAFNQK